jgi:hypothetical protein
MLSRNNERKRSADVCSMLWISPHAGSTTVVSPRASADATHRPRQLKDTLLAGACACSRAPRRAPRAGAEAVQAGRDVRARAHTPAHAAPPFPLRPQCTRAQTTRLTTSPLPVAAASRSGSRCTPPAKLGAAESAGEATSWQGGPGGRPEADMQAAGRADGWTRKPRARPVCGSSAGGTCVEWCSGEEGGGLGATRRRSRRMADGASRRGGPDTSRQSIRRRKAKDSRASGRSCLESC